MTADDNEFDRCACGHARDEHKTTGFTRGCLVEGCGCLTLSITRKVRKLLFRWLERREPISEWVDRVLVPVIRMTRRG
jgi:hypothetical protein